MSAKNSKIPSPARSTRSQNKRPASGLIRKALASPARRSSSRASNGSSNFSSIGSGGSTVGAIKSFLDDNTNIAEPKNSNWYEHLEDRSAELRVEVIPLETSDNSGHGVTTRQSLTSRLTKNLLLESSDNDSMASIVIPKKTLFSQKSTASQEPFIIPAVAISSDKKRRKSKEPNETVKVTKKKGLFERKEYEKNNAALWPDLIDDENRISDAKNENEGKKKLFSEAAKEKEFVRAVLSSSEDDSANIPVLTENRIFSRKKGESLRFPRRSAMLKSLSDTVPNSPSLTGFEGWKHLPSSTMIANDQDELGTSDEIPRIEEILIDKSSIINNVIEAQKQQRRSRENIVESTPKRLRLTTSASGKNLQYQNVNEEATQLPSQQNESTSETSEEQRRLQESNEHTPSDNETRPKRRSVRISNKIASPSSQQENIKPSLTDLSDDSPAQQSNEEIVQLNSLQLQDQSETTNRRTSKRLSKKKASLPSKNNSERVDSSIGEKNKTRRSKISDTPTSKQNQTPQQELIKSRTSLRKSVVYPKPQSTENDGEIMYLGTMEVENQNETNEHRISTRKSNKKVSRSPEKNDEEVPEKSQVKTKSQMSMKTSEKENIGEPSEPDDNDFYLIQEDSDSNSNDQSMPSNLEGQERNAEKTLSEKKNEANLPENAINPIQLDLLQKSKSTSYLETNKKSFHDMGMKEATTHESQMQVDRSEVNEPTSETLVERRRTNQRLSKKKASLSSKNDSERMDSSIGERNKSKKSKVSDTPTSQQNQTPKSELTKSKTSLRKSDVYPKPQSSENDDEIMYLGSMAAENQNETNEQRMSKRRSSKKVLLSPEKSDEEVPEISQEKTKSQMSMEPSEEEDNAESDNNEISLIQEESVNRTDDQTMPSNLGESAETTLIGKENETNLDSIANNNSHLLKDAMKSIEPDPLRESMNTRNLESNQKSLHETVMKEATAHETQLQVDQSEANDPASVDLKEVPVTSLLHESRRVEMKMNLSKISKAQPTTSKGPKQTTLQKYLEKIKADNVNRKQKAVDTVLKSLKPTANVVKAVKIVSQRPKKLKKAIPDSQVAAHNKTLEARKIDGVVYKTPKLYMPKNWVTQRLYNFLEGKLEPKYNVEARVRAERLIKTIVDITAQLGRKNTDKRMLVRMMERELARHQVVVTYLDYYEFLHEYMPHEIKIMTMPHYDNDLPAPKNGVLSNILN